MEKKNSKNAYVCQKLHSIVTIHLVDGVTPMFIDCPTCGSRATSMMGQIDQSLQPSFEWYKPTKEECLANAKKWIAENKVSEMKMLSEAMVVNSFLEHLQRGGLFMRKINS